MSEVLKITGTVSRDGSPFEGAYIDLVDTAGAFIAERRTGPDGAYSFHTTPGTWTLICRTAGADPVTAEVSGTDEVARDFDV